MGDNMDSSITLNINGDEKVYPKGVSLYDVSRDYQKFFSYPILGALVNNDMADLSYKISTDARIKFFDMSTRMGHHVYQRGLIFLLVYTVKLMYGYKRQLRICHSIDQGIRVKCDISLTKESLYEIKNKMEEIAKSGLTFNKCLVNKQEAIKYFNSNTEYSKADSLKYISNHYINLYKLDNMYDYFYSILPYDVSVYTDFDLEFINSKEFILEFPTILNDFKVPEYKNHPKIVEAFNENYKLARKLNIFNVGDLNGMVAKGSINDIIHLNEVISNNNLLDLAKNIYGSRDKVKLILIAGPSSSGKTTTSKKLSMFLKSFGMSPVSLSIDNYFLNRKDTPKLPNGDYDYESVRALDLKLFHNHLDKILNGEEVSVPTYNFQSGVKEYLGKKVKLDNNGILIVEGLHGLNEELTSNIKKEEKLKIYVSPLTDLNIDDYNMVSTSDVRLLRRIVRDNRNRGYLASETINTFDAVRSGEENNIFPYQGDADFVYNSALIYEIGVLKLYALPLLYEIENTDPSYAVARRLINVLNMFLSIPTDAIPEDSVLREFIGKSYFEE